MDRLPAELVVVLAENMDIRTLLTFMAANRQIAEVIKAHEKSIVKTRTAYLALRPPGSVLSSHTAHRHVCPPHSFALALEVEVRERRIDAILSSGFLDMECPAALRPSGPLSEPQRRRLVRWLSRALHHCDRIADLAADTSDAVVPGRYEETTELRVWQRPARSFDPFTNRHARGRQMEYIKALSVEDAAALFCMSSLATHGYLCAHRYLEHDPNVWERMTVFEEALLRHGSWFLWAEHADASETMRTLSMHVLSTGLVELIDWETGKPGMQKGLRMTLFEAARGVFQESKSERIATNLLDIARKLVIDGKPYPE